MVGQLRRHEAPCAGLAPVPHAAPPFALGDARVVHAPLAALDLDDSTFQCRVTLRPEAVTESIRRHGIQTPLVVRRSPACADRFQIVCGFHRAAAARQLGLATVPVVVRTLDDGAAQTLSCTENAHRQTLDDLDRALSISKLRATGRTTAQLGEILRLGPRQVQRLERLLDCPDVVKQAMADSDGAVTATHALVLMQAFRTRRGRLDLGEWLCRIREESMSVDALRDALRRALAPCRRIRRPWSWSGRRFAISLRAVAKWSPAERARATSEVHKLLAMLEG